MGPRQRYFVANMTWPDVAKRIADGASAIVPVGAGAKQHGTHMAMATDQVQAEWFAEKLAERIDALIWPTLTYGSYPAFIAYAGSISLSDRTFEALVAEIMDGLASFGVNKIFVLNTGLSTIGPVDRAITRGDAQARVHHLKIYAGPHCRHAMSVLSEQLRGGHADEIETSIMLAISPSLVEMALARPSPPSLDGKSPGPLDPEDAASPNFSPSGSIGNPTLGTAKKGRVLTDAILNDLVDAVASTG